MRTLRPGLAAIAAATALSSTIAFAQADPGATTGPIVLPESSLPSTTTTTTTATPTIVIPDAAPVTPKVSAPAPVAEPVSTRAPATTTARQAPRATTVAARTQAPSAPANTQAASSASVSSEPLASDAVSPSNVVPMSAEVAPVEIAPAPAEPVATQRADVTEGLAKLLAGLLVAGVAVGGFLLLRRRRSIVGDEAPVIRQPVVGEPVDRELPADRATVSEPAVTTPAFAATSSYDDRRTIGTVGGLPNDGAAIALPAVAPTDYDERTSLLRRMVAARPDRANPFRSPGARLKRARLILASLGRKFERTTPRIDLSQYTSNWPALARGNRMATA